MKIIDLFSGIGGFSLGLEATGGFETVQFVENNEWCQKVLAKNFPGVPITGDIRNYEGQEQADVVVGGFPCQPFSVAGKRKGTEDDRHLWPEMLRVIKASKPRFVIGENVRNLTSIENGMVFEQVCVDLENEGYEVQSFVIPASAVNAPHQRYRVWIVAYSDSKLCRGGRAIEPSGENKDRELYSAQEEQTRKHLRSKTVRCNSVRGETENVANSDSEGLQRYRESSSELDKEITSTSYSKEQQRGMDHERFSFEPRVGRVAHGISRRVDRIKGLGNAIVPQIAYQIGLAILEAEKEEN